MGCPDDHRHDPRTGCGCISNSEYDAILNGKECAVEGKKCDEPGFEYNEEACTCLTEYTCRMGCPKDHRHDPRTGCGCISNSEYYAILNGKECAVEENKCDEPGFEYNEEACTCLTENTCRMGCPKGQRHDPRTGCGCITNCEYDAIMNGKECAVEEDKCDEPGFEYNEKACTCLTERTCRMGCPKDHRHDPRTGCGCISNSEYDAILNGIECAVEENKCDLPGFEYDEDACMCLTKATCRMGCPKGQSHDPRTGCGCISNYTIDSIMNGDYCEI